MPKVERADCLHTPPPSYMYAPGRQRPASATTNAPGELYLRGVVKMTHYGTMRYKKHNPAIPTTGTEVKFGVGKPRAVVYAEEGNFIYGVVRTRDGESILHHLSLGTRKVQGYIGKVGDGYSKNGSTNYDAEIIWWLV